MQPHQPPIVSKKVLIPFVLITLLFALWGFANAVTDPMVQAFKKVLELSNTQAAWVQMAFYGGYFCMALPAALFVRKYSYKAGVMVGLIICYGCIIILPSSYNGTILVFLPRSIYFNFWIGFFRNNSQSIYSSYGR